MKKLTSLFLSAILALSLVACASNPASAPQSTVSSTAQSTSQAVQTKLPETDRAGNSITIPAEVKTIISMAPSITQEIIELGHEDKLIAVDTQSAMMFPQLKEDVLKMDMMTPDVETMVAKNPDIVFVTTMSAAGGADPFKAVKNANICVASIPTSLTVQDVANDIIFVADCIGESEAGNLLASNMLDTFNKVMEIGKTITTKKTVLFEIAALPAIYSFGKGVFLNEMIEAIGATNVLADQESWVAVVEEAAVAASPDVILTNVNYIEKPVDEIKARKSWQEVKAVKNGEVYYIDNAASSLPNHHIADALIEMAKAVYPTEFANLK